MANPITFLFGYKIITASLKDAADIFNICGRYGIVYRRPRTDDSGVIFECSLGESKRLFEKCKANGITLISENEKGLPHLIKRYRRRYGILAGVIISLFLLFLSGRFVWDVRVEGKLERLNKADVISELKRCGLKVGMPMSKLNTSEVETRVIVFSDDISWISINISGTVAHVEIREAQPIPESEALYDAANLVAEHDGVIEGFEEVKGNIEVKIGDRVSKGDLLVSGIYDSPALGFIYRCAKGKVFARVENEYEICVPLQYDKKTYTGKEYVEKYLIFFDKEIKIYTNFGKKSSSCDIIDTISYIDPIKKGELPIGIRTVRYAEYRYVTSERSREDTIELAFNKLRLKEEELGICDVISKSLSGKFETRSDGEVYVLKCSAVSVKNIALQVKIEIDNEKESQNGTGILP